jgi:hypothetical protein
MAMSFGRNLIVVLLLFAPTAGLAQSQAEPPSFADRTAGLTRLDGYFPLYWDATQGKLLLEISRFNEEFLYQVTLPAGVGSNPLGLDRGQVGPGAVVFFDRVGPRVLLVQPNYRFRALSDDAAERRAVADSFASSVLWGFQVLAADGDRVLVDATTFFLRDAHGVIPRLRSRQQGRYRLDDSRSAIYLPRTKSFPLNTEVEATLTFVTDEDPGALVRDTTPTPEALTVRQHHSLVQLPPPGYAPRRFDPRVGYMSEVIFDYASPVTSALEQRWVVRHRLQKKDPGAARSEAVKPIVFYVDRGAPPLIRQALIDGASWWAKSFEAAGFIDGFQVKVLPEDADPMDVRYNVINWVHRSTRGWSYGANVVDPRSGELIKGNVTLGSLRIRQNILINSVLVLPDGTPNARGACAFGDMPDLEALLPPEAPAQALEAALARLRQLSAHEVGHTLGLDHNFAASAYGRASVMDYPAPLVTVVDGKLDLSNAYGVGTGAYDHWAIRYGYTQFAPGTDEESALAALVREGLTAGLHFVSDDDARPAGAMHPAGSLWDNGADPVAMLRQQMEVRRIALAQLAAESVPAGEPLSLLEARLLPIYLHHRYQLQAAAKVLGGARFAYSVREAGGLLPRDPLTLTTPSEQRAALDALLDATDPEFLRVPNRLLQLLPPPAYGYEVGIAELFDRKTAPLFDQLSAATIAADLAVSAILHPQRAARLVDFRARNSLNPDIDEVFHALVRRAFPSPPAAEDGTAVAIRRAVQTLVATRLMELSANPSATFEVRAGARAALRRIRTALASRTDSTAVALREVVGRHLERPDEPVKPSQLPRLPAGEPIGD